MHGTLDGSRGGVAEGANRLAFDLFLYVCVKGEWVRVSGMGKHMVRGR